MKHSSTGGGCGAAMIRQAISCDICGSEKQQTNHWFVAYESAGELRLAAWHGLKNKRAMVKHLCGQKCVYRLLDEFMAKQTALNAQMASTTATAPIAEVTHIPASQALSKSSLAPPTPLEPVDRALTQPTLATFHGEAPLSRLAWERERALLQRTDRYPAHS